MFEEYRLAVEQDYLKKADNYQRKLKENQLYSLAYHIFNVSTSIVLIVILIYGSYSFVHNSYTLNNTNIFLFFGALALSILQAHYKRDCRVLEKIVLAWLRLRSKQIRFFLRDYLSRYYWYCMLWHFLWFSFLSFMYFTHGDVWIYPQAAVPKTKAIFDSLESLITFAGVLLAIQVALFNFMLQHVLSKFSGVIAQEVTQHRSFSFLMGSSIFTLIFSYLIITYGYPAAIESLILPYLASTLLFTLLLSIHISRIGLRENQSIHFFGLSRGRKISKSIPTPLNLELQKQRLWIFLGYFGLDFRSPSKIMASMPPFAVNLTLDTHNALLGVANKALIEGQRDVFIASLNSIEVSMSHYSVKRKLYHTTQDSVFTYLNYQLAGLIETTSKSQNEYLISDLIISMGRLSKLSYCLGKWELIDLSTAPSDKRVEHGRNFMVSLWMNNFFQSFESTHVLTRSTGASDSIRQLGDLTIYSIAMGNLECVTLSFLPTIRKITATCLASIGDAYHLFLFGQCFKKVVYILAVLSTYRLHITSTQDSFKETLKLIEELSNLYFFSQATSFSLDDPVNGLTSKLDENQPCIQEIFYIILNRKIYDIHDYKLNKNELSDLLKLNTKLAKLGVNSGAYISSSYFEAFYEMSYLILRGIPKPYTQYDQKENETRFDFSGTSDPVSSKNQFIDEIFKNLTEMMECFYPSERVNHDWIQSAFSTIGLAVAVCKTNNDVYLKAKVIEFCRYIFSKVKADYDSDTSPPCEMLKYLQLTGAWIEHYSLDQPLSENIANLVVTNRRRRGGMGMGSSGRYGYYGYPTIHHCDFGLPQLSGLVNETIVSESAYEQYIEWNNSLINDDIMKNYYKIIVDLEDNSGAGHISDGD